MSRGSAVAYGQGVYLVVSAMGTLNGRFVSEDGAPLGGSFAIGTTGQYAVFPRAAFSPDADGGAGAFLVTWSESATPIQVHARMVSYGKGGGYGTDTVIGNSSSFEAGCAVAYSTGSQEFLVVWKNEATLNVDAVRVGNSGNLLGVVAFPQTPDGERDPSVAYNPDDNQFLVVYSGWNSRSAFVAARRVQSGTGVVLDGAVLGVSDDRILLMTAGGTYITDVSYNRATRKYLASWFALNASLGQLVNPDGTLSGGIITLSTYWKAYDALSVAYNPISGTSFLVSHSSTVEDGGVEIRADSQPVDNGIPVTAAGGSGNFYPRVAANTTRTEWLLSTANSFTSTMAQRIHTDTVAGAPPPPPPPPKPSKPTKADLDGDGKADLTVFRPSTGEWVTLKSRKGFVYNPSDPDSFSITAFGIAGGDMPISSAADFDGDGRSDLAFFRPTGTDNLCSWFIKYSSNPDPAYSSTTWGYCSDKPVPADFDGDGKADLALYRPSTGRWYVLLSGSGFTTWINRKWGAGPGDGLPGPDTPVAGDFDGDKKADFAVYRPSTGRWFVLLSTSGWTAWWTAKWGLDTTAIPSDYVGDGNPDIPVASDYDGDGMIDFAVYRPSTTHPNYWFVLNSSSGYTTYTVSQWGAPGDVPTPADYDGDGFANVAVYRPSTGRWYIMRPGHDGLYIDWGLAGDIPAIR